MGLSLAYSAVKKGAQVTVVLGANAALYPAKERHEFLQPKIKFHATCSKILLPKALWIMRQMAKITTK